MSGLLDDTTKTLLELANPDPHPILAEMQAYGDKRGFPTIGPAVGRFLAVAAAMVDARRVFEFRSGFGYSAAWFATVLPPEAELFLTDFDPDDLERATRFIETMGFEGNVRTRSGDALEGFEAVDGPFDVVLIDLDKRQYVDAFDRAKDAVEPGGIVIADDMMAGPVDAASVTDSLRGDSTTEGSNAAIARYIETVRDVPHYETVFLPVGDGISISAKNA
ncbi:MAG: O-methyltransferase [archaeon]